MNLNELKRAVMLMSSLLILVFLTTCGFTTGPPLDVQILQHYKSSTTGDRTLCCCRIKGLIENRSTVAVHVTLTFDGYRIEKGKEEKAGVAIDFVRNILPGEVREFDATGFLWPCAEIVRYELAEDGIDIRGLWYPP